eukprot:4428024-Prymnesium_polylepis.1
MSLYCRNCGAARRQTSVLWMNAFGWRRGGFARRAGATGAAHLHKVGKLGIARRDDAMDLTLEFALLVVGVRP